MLSVDAALAALLQMADEAPIDESLWVPLADASGRVLAEDLLATADLPPWPNSAMDGYALRLADWQGASMVVSQRIFAGHPPQPLAPGTCARIFTGAPLPPGADCIEIQENCQVLDNGEVLFGQQLVKGRHIRPQGQEARLGDCLLARGTRLGPIELALAASLGSPNLLVRRRLRVALLSSGDELVEPGEPLQAGQIYNSNRALLRAWLDRLGCEVFDWGILADDLDATRARLAESAGADLILSTGGVSVGDADVLGQVLREQGELTFWKLALKPGKPLTCGHYNGVPVIGLPGNPGSSLVTFAMLARPYLLRRLGVQEVEPTRYSVLAGFDWPQAGSRREYLRVRLENGRAVLHPDQSSAVLRSAAWADGLLEVPENSTFRLGDAVRFIALSELLG